MSAYKPGASVRHYDKQGTAKTCGERVGSYAGAMAHWRVKEDPCPECTVAAREYWRDLRRRRRIERPVEQWPHGKPACYKDYGCRRPECREAAAAYRRANNAARQATGRRPV